MQIAEAARGDFATGSSLDGMMCLFPQTSFFAHVLSGPD
jgi:hypothetical protein